MNFNLFVQHNKWLVVALLGGVILTILVILTYTALWRPREEAAERESRIRIDSPPAFFWWVVTFMPWVLVLIVIGSVIYAVTHILSAAIELPNW